MVNKAIKMHQFTKCEAVPETAQIWNIKMLPKIFLKIQDFEKNRQCFFCRIDTKFTCAKSAWKTVGEVSIWKKVWRYTSSQSDRHICCLHYSTTNKPSKTIHLHTGCSRKNAQSFAHDRFRITCRTSCQTKNIQLQYYNSVLFHVIN